MLAKGPSYGPFWPKCAAGAAACKVPQAFKLQILAIVNLAVTAAGIMLAGPAPARATEVTLECHPENCTKGCGPPYRVGRLAAVEVQIFDRQLEDPHCAQVLNKVDLQ